jgi:hypothetical protein
MKIRSWLFFLGLLFHSYAYSQVYVFMVCGSRGENAVKTNGEWKLLKNMSTIDKFDEIKTVGDHCYLGLLHSSGRSITIRQAGSFSAADLLKKINTGKTVVATKYADFVYTKMTTPERKPADVKQRAGDEDIKILIPSSGEFLGSDEIIRWTPVKGANKYRVIIKTMTDDIVMQFTSDSSFSKINFNDEKLKDQEDLIISVELLDNPSVTSDTYAIIRLKDEKARNISQDFSEIKKDIGEESSLNYLIFASFFEKNNLLIDAATCYQMAINLTPDIPDFREMYHQFLFRNGLL